MSHEIERKFLIVSSLEDILGNTPRKCLYIDQRYLPDSGDWTIRVRQVIEMSNVSFFLTMKKKVTNVTCIEIEMPITQQTYEQMLPNCGLSLSKIRYEVEYMGHLWEIDQFINPVFDGLIIAEIELSSEEEVFEKPSWLGKEVTHDKKYKNARMAKMLT